MRFAIATIDRYIGIFDTFCQAGWRAQKLFTVPIRDPEFGNQRAAIALAEQQSAAIQLSRITARDIAELGRDGCEVLIVAGYDWKVPPWAPLVNHAVNFHPAPLPQGRGPYPLPRAILENRPIWGVSCHRLSSEFDAGDILASELFAMHPDECHESLDLRVQMAGKKLAARVARDFPALWRAAVPQDSGSYWPKINLRERVLDFGKPLAELLRHVRAYGRTGSIINLAGTWLIVKRASGWHERHAHRPGDIVHVYGREAVIAAADGYLALLESDVAPPHVVLELATAAPTTG